MTTTDNAPPPEGWRPYAKCCGVLHDTVACSVCGEYVKPTISANIELGAE